MSDTPLTDAFIDEPVPCNPIGEYDWMKCCQQWADFARQLERSLAAMTAERDEWKEKFFIAESQVDNADATLAQSQMAMKSNHKREIDALRAELSTVMAERDVASNVNQGMAKLLSSQEAELSTLRARTATTKDAARAVDVDRRFFSYDPIGGDFLLHNSIGDAKAESERVFDYCIEEAACDGWPENTDGICWGEIKGGAFLIDSIERPKDNEINDEGNDASGNNWSNPEWSRIEKHELRDIAAPTSDPEGAAHFPSVGEVAKEIEYASADRPTANRLERYSVILTRFRATDAARIRELETECERLKKEVVAKEERFIACVSHLESPYGFKITEPGCYISLLKVFPTGGFVRELKKVTPHVGEDAPYPCAEWREFHKNRPRWPIIPFKSYEDYLAAMQPTSAPGAEVKG